MFVEDGGRTDLMTDRDRNATRTYATRCDAQWRSFSLVATFLHSRFSSREKIENIDRDLRLLFINLAFRE